MTLRVASPIFIGMKPELPILVGRFAMPAADQGGRNQKVPLVGARFPTQPFASTALAHNISHVRHTRRAITGRVPRAVTSCVCNRIVLFPWFAQSYNATNGVFVPVAPAVVHTRRERRDGLGCRSPPRQVLLGRYQLEPTPVPPSLYR